MERKCKKLTKDLKKNLNLDAQPINEGESIVEAAQRPESKSHSAGPAVSGSGGYDEEDDDDFGYDPDRYVPFDEKAELADSLKKVTKEGLTQIVNYLKEKQPDALEDFGNDRLQLKIDAIEREAFNHCRELINLNVKEVPGKRQKNK